MDQNAGYSGTEWSLQRRPFQCVLGQASRAFSSMSIVAPNCCQRAVLNKGSICIPPVSLCLIKPLMQELNGPLPGKASSLGVILRAILLEEPMMRSGIQKE